MELITFFIYSKIADQPKTHFSLTMVKNNDSFSATRKTLYHTYIYLSAAKYINNDYKQGS